MQNDICQVRSANNDKVNKIKSAILPNEESSALAEAYSVLSDGARIKILLSLTYGELCVCDISQVLNSSISAVSHQLRLLRGLRLVKYRNEGRMVYYSLYNKNIIKVIQEGIKYLGKG